MCELSETATNCAADCENLKFVTTATGNRGSTGAVFYIRALRDIVVTSLDFYGSSTNTDLVKVYTRFGKYDGHEVTPDGWNVLYDNPSLKQLGRTELTQLGKFDTVVSISAGTFQSFYIYTPSKLMYDVGTSALSEGSVYSSDDMLEFYEGVGVTNLFSGNYTRDVHSPRIFKGVIR